MYGSTAIEVNDQPPEITAKMDESDNDHDRLRSISWTLIIGAAFDEFAFGMFGFILVVFLSSAYPDSLMLVSVYGLANGLMMFFSGGATGRFIDAGIADNRRLQSTIILLLLQYTCMLACCTLCYAFLRLTSDLWLPPIILLSGFVSLSRAASSISIENDWLVVISGSNTEYLSGLNVKL